MVPLDQRPDFYRHWTLHQGTGHVGAKSRIELHVSMYVYGWGGTIHPVVYSATLRLVGEVLQLLYYLVIKNSDYIFKCFDKCVSSSVNDWQIWRLL